MKFGTKNESLNLLSSQNGKSEKVGKRAVTMISDAILRSRFEMVWALMPEKYLTLIERRKTLYQVRVVTSDKLIPSSVRIAGAMCGDFYFRLNLIKLSDLDEVLVHEILHYYIEEELNLKRSHFEIVPSLSTTQQAFDKVRVQQFVQGLENRVAALLPSVLNAVESHPEYKPLQIET